MANGRTKRRFNNPRMDPKVVSQTIEHAKDAHVVNTGMPDDEDFFETIERHVNSPVKNSVNSSKNGYKEFESLMNDLKNGGDIDSIRSKIKGDFRDNSQKYMERYIKENYGNAAHDKYVKDVDLMFDGDPDIDGYYEAIENVTVHNKDTDFNLIDVEKDADGNINLDKVVDDISNGNTRTINANTIYNNKINQINKKRQAEANRKNQAQHQKNVNKKIDGAKNQLEFEEIVSRRETDLKIKELEKIANDTNLPVQERANARREIGKIKNERNIMNAEADDLYDASQKVNSKNAKERKEARKKIKKEYVKDPKKYDELIKIGEMNAKEAKLQKEYDDLKKRASDKTLSKKERKKARRELVNHEMHGGLDNYRKKTIQNTDRGIVDDYLDDKYEIKKNAADLDQLKKDLDTAGGSFLDLNGKEFGSINKKINKTLTKAGLKIKGFFKGDYSEYDEYVEAVERLENMNPRDFNIYEQSDIDNLFDSNGHLNNADDINNLKPTRTTSAKDAFEDWQKNIKNPNYRTQAAASTSRAARAANTAKQNILNSAPNAKKLFTAQGAFGVGFNLFNTVSTYKEERKEGHGVISSGLRAGVDFALGEVLGMKYMGVMAAQAAPRAITKGIEGIGKLTREKNNMQRHEAFGYASFQDTQQLATMRQSGMEMAKMANYNLQQTLMGNEAKYMHR